MRAQPALPGLDVLLPPLDSERDPLRLHLVEHGRRQTPESPPLLFLHGLPTNSFLWREVARDLEHHQLCLMPDLVGMGASERPADRSHYRLDGQARAMLRLLDVLGIERAVLVAHDLGGGVAVHLAAQAPDRVAALVLIDTPLHEDAWAPPSALPLLTPVLGEIGVRGIRMAPGLAEKAMARGFGTSLPPAELRPYVEPLLRADGARGLLAMARGTDLTAVEAAWRLVCASPPPTLVLWGEQDQLHAPSYGRRIAGEVSGTWSPVGDADHLLPQQRPERVSEEICGFLAEIAERPTVTVG
jgi:pimeloyl-ACP methyl ester carboxylesterase